MKSKQIVKSSNPHDRVLTITATREACEMILTLNGFTYGDPVRRADGSVGGFVVQLHDLFVGTIEADRDSDVWRLMLNAQVVDQHMDHIARDVCGAM